MDTYKTKKVKKSIAWTVAFVLAIFWLIVSIFPFGYMLMNSFKGRFEIMTSGVFTLPESWFPANYLEVLQGDFWKYFLNSVIVLVVSLAVLLMLAAAAAYPLARMKFRFGKLCFSLIIACMSIPIHITLIPIFRMTTKTGLYDSIWALIGPYVAFGIPISVFILTGFMKDIPKEIEEAAMLDGCGKFQAFFRIILPMSKPGLATLAIYNGVNMWNEFSFAYTLTQSASNRTLPLSIWEYKGQYTMNTPMILSVLTLTVLPMILLFICTKEKLIEGMSAGAVKG
ncbi:MAG: carbohydrate ABC transporter permease [Lachnospiraceae bacterium]|nr:carbohydrate ABC transporter permease [Lachnospiraceae bacterium]